MIQRHSPASGGLRRFVAWKTLLQRIVFWLCCAAGTAAPAGESTTYDGQLRMERNVHLLAARLKDAPLEARADFALVALSEMIQAYGRETARARAELRRTGGNSDLSRWVRAVDGLIVELQGLLDAISPETPVQISGRDAGTVYLIVNGSPVLLSGPRVSDTADFEQRVLDRFCSRNYCDDLFEEEPAREPASATPESHPLWRFSDQGGPVCATGDGLEIQFRSASDLRRKREICTRVVAELNSLIAALRSSISEGKPVEWGYLAIRPDPGTNLERVVLNAGGDYVLLPLPSLSGAQQFFAASLPWVAGRVEDRRYNLVILNAEEKLGLSAAEPENAGP
jgi:hypothetical protein